MEIYIVTHKKFNVPKVSGYLPIQVGKENNGNLGYLADDIGNDNISKKNESYCELTAIYWIWKNSKADIIGITHYRRYFFKNFFNKNIKKILSEKEVKKILKQYDAIVPLKHIMKKYTVKEEYENNHYVKDLNNARNIILQLYPEYVDTFDKVMNSKQYYQWNMWITKKEIFDLYAEWLFNILFELEKVTDISSYDNYNKRIYGFLAERLFNVWLIYNNITIKEMPVIKVDDSYVKNFYKVIKYYIKLKILPSKKKGK